MDHNSRIFIVGGGAIGFSLAVHLKNAGKDVTILRASENNAEESNRKIAVESGDGSILEQEIFCKPLSSQGRIEGIVILATKAIANDDLAEKLLSSAASIDLLIMQNGIGVERPFLNKGFRSLSRCVVYITAERIAADRYTARMIKPSPVGPVSGGGGVKSSLASVIATNGFDFYEETDIDREIWKKGIINAAFNSICPLLDVDNGIFDRDAAVLDLARKLVLECVPVANRIGIAIGSEEVIDQIVQISKRSSGQLISTLQDIKNRRETEIRFLNSEICRVAEQLTPAISLPLTRILGELTLKKSQLAAQQKNHGHNTDISSN